MGKQMLRLIFCNKMLVVAVLGLANWQLWEFVAESETAQVQFQKVDVALKDAYCTMFELEQSSPTQGKWQNGLLFFTVVYFSIVMLWVEFRLKGTEEVAELSDGAFLKIDNSKAPK